MTEKTQNAADAFDWADTPEETAAIAAAATAALIESLLAKTPEKHRHEMQERLNAIAALDRSKLGLSASRRDGWIQEVWEDAWFQWQPGFDSYAEHVRRSAGLVGSVRISFDDANAAYAFTPDAPCIGAVVRLLRTAAENVIEGSSFRRLAADLCEHLEALASDIQALQPAQVNSSEASEASTLSNREAVRAARLVSAKEAAVMAASLGNELRAKVFSFIEDDLRFWADDGQTHPRVEVCRDPFDEHKRSSPFWLDFGPPADVCEYWEPAIENERQRRAARADVQTYVAVVGATREQARIAGRRGAQTRHTKMCEEWAPFFDSYLQHRALFAGVEHVEDQHGTIVNLARDSLRRMADALRPEIDQHRARRNHAQGEMRAEITKALEELDKKQGRLTKLADTCHNKRVEHVKIYEEYMRRNGGA